MSSEAPETTSQQTKGRHAGHGWLMMACCIPMLAIAVALVATGVAGVGFIVAALVCTAMMAVMMRGMSHRDSGEENRPHAGHHE